MLYLSLDGLLILRTFGLVMSGNVATYYNSRCQEVTLCRHTHNKWNVAILMLVNQKVC